MLGRSVRGLISKGGQKFKMFCGPRFAFDTFCDQWVVPMYFSISRGFTIVQGAIHTEGGSDCPPFLPKCLAWKTTSTSGGQSNRDPLL